jgi:hypothetical protein
LEMLGCNLSAADPVAPALPTPPSPGARAGSSNTIPFI